MTENPLTEPLADLRDRGEEIFSIESSSK